MRKLRRTYLAAFLVALVSVSTQAASVLTTIHTFAGSPNDGESPLNVMIGGNGTLYGVTQLGGKTDCLGGCGTVFSLTPPAAPGGVWTETVYIFPARKAGVFPGAGVVFGPDGALYGATLDGGSSNNGTVFALRGLAGSTTERVIFNFDTRNGATPQGGVAFGIGGVGYGTTVSGGAGGGTVFSLTPSDTLGAWTETILHNFNFGEGINPYAGVVIGHGSGVLYGTTVAGGTANNGIVFSLSPPASPGGAWEEHILHSFTDADGSQPRNGSLVIGDDGVLYGTTVYGGTSGNSTVFSLTPPATPGDAWTEAVLHSFGSSPGDGVLPQAGVTIGDAGVLYGTTYEGGANGHGTVFSLTPPAIPAGAWTETVLHNFAGLSDGGGPWANVVLSGGILYGTTLVGGTWGKGTLFPLTP